MYFGSILDREMLKIVLLKEFKQIILHVASEN
jgi:hypothetical protein